MAPAPRVVLGDGQESVGELLGRLLRGVDCVGRGPLRRVGQVGRGVCGVAHDILGGLDDIGRRGSRAPGANMPR